MYNLGHPQTPGIHCGKVKLSYIYYVIRRGKAELCILELTSVFHHLPIVGPGQLCVLAHLRMYQRSGYFLVRSIMMTSWI